MRTELEIKKKINTLQERVNLLEDSNNPYTNKFVHECKREICLLKWVLEPAYNEHVRMSMRRKLKKKGS